MDPTTLLHPPATTDNQTVILWSLGVLMVVAAGLFKLFYDGNRRCEERGKLLEEKVDRNQEKYDAAQTLTQTVLVAALNRNSDKLKDMEHALIERDLIPSDMKSDSETDVYSSPAHTPNPKSKRKP
jgi:hypothetical protein